MSLKIFVFYVIEENPVGRNKVRQATRVSMCSSSPEEAKENLKLMHPEAEAILPLEPYDKWIKEITWFTIGFLLAMLITHFIYMAYA